MWPFSTTIQLTEEQKERVLRKCGLSIRTLQNCWRANPTHSSVCNSLEMQVVFCQAEAVCPKLASEYEACFRRVVNSKGKEPYSACDKQVAAMKKALQRQRLYPIPTQ